jgi:hypothetical protein
LSSIDGWLALSGAQETKTRKALEFFSKRLQALMVGT